MRALWIVDRFPPDRGGLGAAAARQVAALAPRLVGLDVLRLDSDLPPGRAEMEAHGTVGVYRVGRARDTDESLQVLAGTATNLVRQRGHTVVHGVGAAHAGYVATWVARLAGLPSVVGLRGNDLDRAMFHGPRLPLLLWALQHADAVLGVTRDILDRARVLSGRTEGLHHVPNGVDTGVFHPDAGLPADLDGLGGWPRPWLAFSGELRLKKGLPVLLDLAERLAVEAWGTLWLIGGVRAEEREHVVRWRRRARSVAERLREIPWEADPGRLAALCATMDLFVFPSFWDGMPNALLEAMAVGRPVVASAVGGAAEIIRDGESGVLVPPDRLDRFPDAAVGLLRQGPETLARLGVAAREQVRRAFTVEAERDAILAAYAALRR